MKFIKKKSVAVAAAAIAVASFIAPMAVHAATYDSAFSRYSSGGTWIRATSITYAPGFAYSQSQTYTTGGCPASYEANGWFWDGADWVVIPEVKYGSPAQVEYYPVTANAYGYHQAPTQSTPTYDTHAY